MLILHLHFIAVSIGTAQLRFYHVVCLNCILCLPCVCVANSHASYRCMRFYIILFRCHKPRDANVIAAQKPNSILSRFHVSSRVTQTSSQLKNLIQFYLVSMSGAGWRKRHRSSKALIQFYLVSMSGAWWLTSSEFYFACVQWQVAVVILTSMSFNLTSFRCTAGAGMICLNILCLTIWQ